MPIEHLDEPVDPLEQLPGETRLADAGDPGDRDEPSLPFGAGRADELLDRAELLGATDERRLDRFAAAGAAELAEDPERAPRGNDRLLALQREVAELLERDRAAGRPDRRLADEDGAGLGHRLEPGGRVHQVARDDPLRGGADRRGGLAGEDACAGTEVGADVRAEGLDGLEQLERRPDRTLGVVLVRRRRPPDRHHGVADELLDETAVALDRLPGRLEVAGQQVADLLGVTALREVRRADEVGEQDRHETALGRRRGGGRDGRGRARADRRPALPAELAVGSVGRAACVADDHERRAAFLTELAARLVLGPAVRTVHLETSPRRGRSVPGAARTAPEARRQVRGPSRPLYR